METSAIINFAEIIIYLVILFVTLYAITLGYHWFNFGKSKTTSMTALIIYLTGSGIIVTGLITAFNFL